MNIEVGRETIPLVRQEVFRLDPAAVSPPAQGEEHLQVRAGACPQVLAEDFPPAQKAVYLRDQVEAFQPVRVVVFPQGQEEDYLQARLHTIPTSHPGRST